MFWAAAGTGFFGFRQAGEFTVLSASSLGASRGEYNNAHTHYQQENGQPYIWLTMEGVLDLCNGVVYEKTPQLFYLRRPLST